MRTRKVEFTGALGHKLSGIIDEPEGKTRAYAIFSHCFTCNKDYKGIKNISQTLAANRIGTLRYDFTGLGESGGEFSETNFSTMVEDLVLSYNFMTEEDLEPKLLIGLSMGGAASVKAIQELSNIEALVTIGSPYNAAELGDRLSKIRTEAFENGSGTLEIGGFKYELKNQFFMDLDINGSSYSIKDVKKPYLVIHSPDDQTSSFTKALKLFEYANDPKSLISVDGADHLLSDKEHANYVGNMIAEWSKLYIS